MPHMSHESDVEFKCSWKIKFAEIKLILDQKHNDKDDHRDHSYLRLLAKIFQYFAKNSLIFWKFGLVAR